MSPGARLVIADPGLSGPIGHHLGYSQAVAEAAQARGIPALILAGRDFHGQVAGGAVPCRAAFGTRYQTSGGGGGLRRALFAAAARLPAPLAAQVAPPLRAFRRHLRRGAAPDGFGAELAAALGDADGRDLVLLHSVSAANLTGLPATLPLAALCVVLRRTPGEMDRDDPGPEPVGAVLRGLAARFGSRLRLLADTEELAALHAPLAGLPVRVAPLPVVVPPVPQHPPHRPPHLVFAGGARAEKGYALLPPLVAALRGRARFTLHSGPVDAAADPLVQQAQRALRGLAGPDLALLEHGLDPAAYQALLADADLLLLPYDAAAYGPRSSGILAEARALGVPAVVPAGCWMEAAAGPVPEVVFHGPADFAAAVERALAALPGLTAALRAAAPEWRRRHSPEALLDALLFTIR
ncbi:hypothetical protein [Siccirubricoccus sp. G192]|uniref:hypothetical protein n=1 Tax=Siccirubricoccus sp. G192 TaxID=2849651 RepID=UPI001C2BAE72|nr:hypothetical protein [Siccirubricoccus sp. G192]MBV1795919.1 hypothetical protein [Siccirubricoccus sp. G192]